MKTAKEALACLPDCFEVHEGMMAERTAEFYKVKDSMLAALAADPKRKSAYALADSEEESLPIGFLLTVHSEGKRWVAIEMVKSFPEWETWLLGYWWEKGAE